MSIIFSVQSAGRMPWLCLAPRSVHIQACTYICTCSMAGPVRRSHAVLTVDVRYLALSVPGSALPTDLLTGCSLPTVQDMVFDSLHGQRLFKDQRDYAQQPDGEPRCWKTIL